MAENDAAKAPAGGADTPKMMPLAKLRADPEVSARAGMSEEHVRSLMEDLQAGHEMPPLVAFQAALVAFDDGQTVWVSSGFHRLEAMKRLGRSHVPVIVKTGGKRDARLYAAGCNHDHGLRRSHLDKRRAVHTCLELEPGWSCARVAKHVHVGEPLVQGIKKALEARKKAEAAAEEEAEGEARARQQQQQQPEEEDDADADDEDEEDEADTGAEEGADAAASGEPDGPEPEPLDPEDRAKVEERARRSYRKTRRHIRRLGLPLWPTLERLEREEVAREARLARCKKKKQQPLPPEQKPGEGPPAAPAAE